MPVQTRRARGDADANLLRDSREELPRRKELSLDIVMKKRRRKMTNAKSTIHCANSQAAA